MSQPAASSDNRVKDIAFWALKIVFALIFIAAGCAKLYGVPMMVEEFGTIGVGQWFRYVTGIVEVGSGILLLVPRTTFYGALLLTGVCLGAFFAQILVIHQDFIHTIVMGAVVAWITWYKRDQLKLPQ